MGEFADMAISEGIDSYWGFDRRNGVSYWPGRYPPQYTHAAKRCRHCGMAPLYWQKLGSGWRLHAYEGGEYVLHACLTPAPVDRNPQGEKPQALSAKHESAVGEAEAPTPSTLSNQGSTS